MCTRSCRIILNFTDNLHSFLKIGQLKVCIPVKSMWGISITTTYNFNSDISDLVVISSLGVLSVMVRVKCHV